MQRYSKTVKVLNTIQKFQMLYKSFIFKTTQHTPIKKIKSKKQMIVPPSMRHGEILQTILSRVEN